MDFRNLRFLSSNASLSCKPSMSLHNPRHISLGDRRKRRMRRMPYQLLLLLYRNVIKPRTIQIKIQYQRQLHSRVSSLLLLLLFLYGDPRVSAYNQKEKILAKQLAYIINMGDVRPDFYKLLRSYKNLIFTFMLYRMSHSLIQKHPVPPASSSVLPNLLSLLVFVLVFYFGLKLLISSIELT